jgi:hypothetical protein
LHHEAIRFIAMCNYPAARVVIPAEPRVPRSQFEEPPLPQGSFAQAFQGLGVFSSFTVVPPTASVLAAFTARRVRQGRSP